MYKIAFLFDDTNNWIEQYIHSVVFDTEELKNKYSFYYFHDPTQIKEFDVVFILGYTKILSHSFLGQNKLNLIIHESPLPQGKGFSPIQWQILEGKNTIPVCLIEATAKVDSGDIIEKTDLEFSGFELFDEIRKKQGEITISLIKNFLAKYPIYDRTPQSGDETFFARRSNKDDMLDINKTIKAQFNHFRIADNEKYPLWFEIEGEKYFLKIYSGKQ